MIEKLRPAIFAENRDFVNKVNEALDRINKIIAETNEDIKNNKESK